MTPEQVDLRPMQLPASNAKRLSAVSSFFRNDARRILAVASSFTGGRRIIESKLVGYSMEGAIPAHAPIRIRFGEGTDYHVGQVVAYLVNAKLMVVHRVVYHGRFGRARDYLLTRGDAKLIPDPPTQLSAVLGSVTEVQYGQDWQAPRPPAQRLKNRLLSSVLPVLVGLSLEVDVRLAHKLVLWLSHAKWLYSRIKTRLSGKRARGTDLVNGKSTRPRGRRLLFIAVQAFCQAEGGLIRIEELCRRLDAYLQRILGAARNFITAFLAEAMTSDEQSQLTVRLYDACSYYRRDAHMKLYPWEESWFRRCLPPPPARILVGAAGAGREALGLVAAGFEVDAFEPAQECAAECRRRLGERATVQSFRYEDLSAAILDGAAVGDTHFARQRYDAVLLGHGSLTHIVNPDERVRLLRALDLICPTGPILASFWCTEGPEQITHRPGRGSRYGQALGRKVAELRGLSSCSEPNSPRLSFARHRGLAYTFTRAEIDKLSALSGREVVWEEDNTPAPHVTFLRGKRAATSENH
jgi:hypothetical protein